MEELFRIHLKKTIVHLKYTELSRIFTHITGVGDSHSRCIVLRIELCDTLRDSYLLYTLFDAFITLRIVLVIALPTKTNKLIHFKIYQFNLIIFYTTSMIQERRDLCAMNLKYICRFLAFTILIFDPPSQELHQFTQFHSSVV